MLLNKFDTWVLWSFLLVAIFPFFYLCFFNHPIGIHEWDWISNWAGFTDSMGFIEENQYWFNSIGGRYTSNILLVTTDQWYSLLNFRLLFVLNLLLLLITSSWLIRQALPFISYSSSFLLGLIVLVIYCAALTNVYENIYRYTVVAIYQLGLLGNFLVAGLLLRLRKPKTARLLDKIIFPLIIVFTAGTNEISLALLYLSMAAYCGGKVLRQHKIPKLFWFWLFVLLVSSWITVTAPGNHARMTTMGVEIDIVKSLLTSLSATLYLWVKWFSNTLIFPFALCLLPLLSFYKSELQQLPWFNRPLLWSLGLIILVPAVLFPLFLGAGMTTFPERIVDLLFFVFQFCFYGLIISLSLSVEIPTFKKGLLLNTVYRIGILFLIIRVILGDISFNRDHKVNLAYSNRVVLNANIGQLWQTIITGKAKRYDQHFMQQYKNLKLCETDECLLEPLSVIPFGIYDPIYDRRRNQQGDPFIGWYFNGKKQVVKYKK